MSATGTNKLDEPCDRCVVLRFHSEQAEAALGILFKAHAKETIEHRDWFKLFSSEPYALLKQRETEMGIEFTDGDFKKFLLSPEMVRKFSSLKDTVELWTAIDLLPTALRTLDYLPAESRIKARVLPVIKPLPNTFVYGSSADPMVFLYVDPALGATQLETIIAHELHHIGLFPFECLAQERIKFLPSPVRHAVELLGAFREGYAMLAAAGGPDIHPHAVDGAAERDRWDRSLANFGADLKAIERFLLDVVDQRLTREQAERIGMGFYGRQGPWYTVGWHMAAIVEKNCGRDALIECMLDPRLLLLRYNAAVSEADGSARGNKSEVWSPVLISALCPGSERNSY
jgi:hypothetical protein